MTTIIIEAYLRMEQAKSTLKIVLIFAEIVKSWERPNVNNATLGKQIHPVKHSRRPWFHHHCGSPERHSAGQGYKRFSSSQTQHAIRQAESRTQCAEAALMSA